MRKKLLIIALPVLMAMSSCTYMGSATRVDLFKEDTLAHEEVFGGQAIQGPAIRKMGDVVDTDTNYKVGYQIHFDDKGNADDSDDVISIRFIAAIKADYTLMRWTRGVTDSRGQQLKTLSDHRYDEIKGEDVYFDSKVVYTSLNNGSGVDEMTAGEGDFVGYTGFIVYSLLDIPYADNVDAYLGVTLALDEVKTDFYAVKIEKNALGTASAHSFKFASNKEGFFLSMDDRIVDADASTRGENAASFTVGLAADEEFLIVQKTASAFKVWDGWCLQDEDLILVNDNGLMKSTVASRYVFYLNFGNQIYHTKYDEPIGYYVRGAAAQGWGEEDCVADYRFITDPDNKAVILGVSLKVGDFKIANLDWSREWGYYSAKNDEGNYIYPNEGNEYYSIIIGGAKDNFEPQDGYDHGVCNIHCKVAGTYNIYLTNNWYVSFELVPAA